MRRIAPRDTMPTHTVECGYIRDLIVCAKVLLFDIRDMRAEHSLTARKLAEWSLVHRKEVADCGGGYSPSLERFGHDEHIKAIDAFVEKLEKIVDNGGILIDFSEVDIEAAQKAERAIYACERRTVFY